MCTGPYSYGTKSEGRERERREERKGEGEREGKRGGWEREGREIVIVFQIKV